MRDMIRHLDLELVAPVRDGDPHDTRAFETAVAHCASHTSSPYAIHEEVVLIRRLQTELAVGDYAAPANTRAREAGRRLALEIPRLARSHVGPDVIRFTSVAKYLAHFIEQLLARRPVSGWQFRPLARYIGADLAGTLSNLARAEPGAWREVWRLLGDRGLLATVRRRTGDNFRRIRSFATGIDISRQPVDGEYFAANHKESTHPSVQPSSRSTRSRSEALAASNDDDSTATPFAEADLSSLVADRPPGSVRRRGATESSTGSRTSSMQEGRLDDGATGLPRNAEIAPSDPADTSYRSDDRSSDARHGEFDGAQNRVGREAIAGNADSRDGRHSPSRKNSSHLADQNAPHNDMHPRPAAENPLRDTITGGEIPTVATGIDEITRSSPRTAMYNDPRDPPRGPIHPSQPAHQDYGGDERPWLRETDNFRRTLTVDEGWPLFLAAWHVVQTALRKAPSPATTNTHAAEHQTAKTRPDGPSHDDPRPTYSRFLSTRPSAPGTWSDPNLLGTCVAGMVAWLVRETLPANVSFDIAAAEKALTYYGWFDARPVRRALHSAVSTPRAAPVHSPQGDAGSRTNRKARHVDRAADDTSDLPTLRTVPMNRTHALRILAAAHECLPLEREVGARTGTPLIDGRNSTFNSHVDEDVQVVEAAVSVLAGQAGPLSAIDVLAALERRRVPPIVPPAGGSASSVRATDSAALATLSYASQHLTQPERTELAEHIADAVADYAPGELETETAGLFFLVRPLLDIRLHGLASMCGLDRKEFAYVLRSFATLAAGASTQDPAIEYFVFGERGENERSTCHDGDVIPPGGHKLKALGNEVAKCGFGLGLISGVTWYNASADPSVGELCEWMLGLTCKQFAHWLRGFGDSSSDFVLEQFVRRPGAISSSNKEYVLVEWPSSAYDVVLEMAGYLDDLDAVPWWSDRGLRWER